MYNWVENTLLNSINIIHHHRRWRDALWSWSLICIWREVHIWEHLSRYFFILLHLTCKAFELYDIDVVQVVKVSDLHVEADIILLASQTVRAYLLVRDAIQVKSSEHFRQNSLRFSGCGAVNVERSFAHLHPCWRQGVTVVYTLPSIRCV
jgi:hypothetical protein